VSWGSLVALSLLGQMDIMGVLMGYRTKMGQLVEQNLVV